MGCEYGMCYSEGSNRNFFTKAEKIKMLEDYKENLDKESKGVGERIADMKREK